MPNRNRSLALLTAALTCLAPGDRTLGGEPGASAVSEAIPCSCGKQGGWFVAATTNFFACSTRSIAEARTAALRGEALRAQLGKSLRLNDADATWRPKCQLVLHATQASYLASAGRGLEGTVGSSLVRPGSGPVALRRIDVRADGAEYLQGALPHEIVHLLVADAFRRRAAPLWYDEGLAILADPPAKRKLHQRDLEEGIRRGADFRIAEILAADQYPPLERMGVFYGQCAALTQLLLQLGSPEQARRLASRVSTVGVNSAIAECYEFDGLPALETIWRRTAITPVRRASAPVLPGRLVSEHLQLAATR